MPRNKDREGPIQRAIVKYLAIVLPTALIFSVPNELASKVGGGKAGASRQTMIRSVQAAAKEMGMLPGMADVVVFHCGTFIALEVKAEGNYQQPNQKAAQVAVELNGGIYAVVRSIDDVKAVLEKYGIRR